MARKLQVLGYDAVALKGGFNAWRADQPVEPLPAPAPAAERGAWSVERGA